MKDKLKSKIKLPQIDPDDFPYKFYMCWWKDICSSSNWENLTNIKIKTCNMYNYGLVN